MLDLKSTEELCFMTLKYDVKLEEKQTCRFKIDMSNLTNFGPSARKSKNSHFNGLLLNKVYNVSHEKINQY